MDNYWQSIQHQNRTGPIEIAAVKIDAKGEITSFSELINPKMVIPERSIKIHNITNEMVKDSPSLGDTLPKFFQFVGTTSLIAHNAKFDLGFLVCSAKEIKEKLPAADIYFPALIVFLIALLQSELRLIQHLFF